jgi:hypothetical protein
MSGLTGIYCSVQTAGSTDSNYGGVFIARSGATLKMMEFPFEAGQWMS